MANEFIARKGLTAIGTISGSSNLDVDGPITGSALTLSTDLAVAHGGTGASTLTDGGILLGSGTGAITATAVLADGEILIGDGTTDPVALDVGGNGAITILGTIATGVWNGTAIASAYLDADTAHLTTTQTFSGAKTFSAVTTLNSNLNFSGATSSYPRLSRSGTAIQVELADASDWGNLKTGGLTTYGASIFNENSADVDFRVESNNNANMLYIDGGDDTVGIGVVPSGSLNASGSGTLHVRKTAGARNVGERLLTLDLYSANNPYAGYGPGILFQGSDYSSDSGDPNSRAYAAIDAEMVASNSSTGSVADPAFAAGLKFSVNNANWGSSTLGKLTSAMMITSGGDVGIATDIYKGSTYPSAKLEIRGDNAGTTESIVTWGRQDNAVKGVLGYHGSNYVTIGALSDHALAFVQGANDTVAMFIADDLKVGIGTTSPSHALSVVGHVSASQYTGSFSGDGSQLTGLSSAAISSYTNNTNNRVITSVDSSTVNAEANLVFDGTNLGVGGITSMDGLVHIHEGSAGSVTAVAGSNLVVESDGNNYIQMLNPDGNNSGIIFGEADDNDRASIKVDGGSNDMTFTAGATTQMTIDGDNNRVGIGTTSPSSQLDVSGASARVLVTSTTHGNNSAFKLYAESANGTSKHGGIYYAPGDTDAASHLSLSSDNANYHLSITRDNGYVGIGDTDPAAPLEVTAAGYSEVRVADSTNASSTRVIHGDDSGSITVAQDGSTHTDFHLILQKAGGSLYTPLFVSGSGHVGINTTDPGTSWWKNLVVSSSAGGGAGITVRSGTADYGSLYFADGNAGGNAEYRGGVEYRHSNDRMKIWTSGDASTPAIFINSSNQVGITQGGTYSGINANLHVSASSAAQSLLHVEGNLGVDALFVSSSGNVGIGTDSPKIRQYSVWPRLEVTNDASGSVVPDDVRIYLNNPTGSSSAFASLTFGNDSAGISGAVFQNSSTNSSGYGGVNSLNVINVTSGDLALGTNNSVDMTIANGGNVTFVAGAVIGGTTYIGDTANANATLGLTINQGSADNQIFALKSSDVAHGLTSYGGMNTETDDFFSIQKESATLGGAKLQATAEDGATSTVLNFWSAGGTADTTKSTSGLGLVNFYITEHDGSNGRANITADGNVFSVSAYVGGAFATRWILDEDGDTWQAGNITIPATSKIYLDGGADTYIHENSTNSIQVVAGGSIAATFQAGGMFVPATDKIWFDSGADTYIHEVSADKLDVVVGGQTILEIAEGGGGASDYVAIQALNKLYLDGGGNTYISETSGDTMKFYAGGTEMWRLTSTYAYTEGHLAIDSGKKFYLDGISDTYFYQYADNNVRLICGTVDALSIGSNGIVFNEDSQDWDFRIESNDNANMFTINGGTNRIGMGVAAASTKAVHMGGTYGAVSGDANIGLYANWAITGTPNEDIVGVRLSPQMTEAGSGTHSNIFGLQVSPGLTGAGASVSNTAALYVAGAMSGGTNNYALWVDAGAVLFDSTLHVGGALTVTDGSHINATGNVEIDGDIICSEYIYHKADTDTYQRFTTNAWLVRTGGDDRLTIDSNGIVRLGSNGSTAVGTQKAIVSANSVTSRANWQLNIEGDNDAGIVFSEDGTARGHVGYDAGLVATVLGDHANSTRFQTAYSADSASIYIDDNEAFRVTKGVSSGGIYADNATSPHRVEVNTHNIHEAKEGHAITGSAMTVVGNSATDWATGVSDLFLMTPSNDTGKGFQLGFGGGTTTAGATEKYGMIRSEIVNRGNGTAQGDLIFSTYGSGAEQEGFRIDHQGYVGFGVTAPAHKLDIGGMADPVVRIKSDSGGDPKLIFDAAAANRNGMIKFYDNGATAGGFIDYVHNGDKMNFGAGSSTTVNFVVGDGLVEVEKQLHIAQNNAVTSPSSGDNDALISIGADTFVGSASMTLKQNGLYVNSAFTTGATVGNVNQVAINSPGITETGGACTTAASLYVEGAPSAGTNNYALYVDGGNNRFDGSCYFGGDTAQRDHGQASYPVTINYTGSSNQGAAWYDHVTDTSSRYAIWFKRYYNSSWATVGSISTANSSTAYNTSSDYRMKENVVTLTGATARLKQLKPYRFNFKEQWGPADDVKDGFLAHEVAEVVPQAVHGEKDAVDEDGNPDMQGVDTSHLVPLLVATIQELEERITALEAGS